MRFQLNAHLALAAACCSWPPSKDNNDRVTSAARKVTDWSRFFEMVQHHRVRPLVHSALLRAGISLPDDVGLQLKESALVAARRSLLMARECFRLQNEFGSAGLQALIVKGVPLAALCFDNIAIKEGWDIDLLVLPDDATSARTLLETLGYKISSPELSTTQFERFVGYSKEAEFLHPGTGITTELHWQLVDTGDLLAGVSARGPIQKVHLPAGTLRTLANEPLFAYLCLHGASHNWTRIKWLADVNAFVARCSARELETLVDYAFLNGAGRSATVALCLCKALFNSALPDSVLEKLEEGLVIRALVRNVIAGWNYGGGAVEPLPYSSQWLRLLGAAFFLTPGLKHRWAQLRHLWIEPVDRARLALPDHLSFLYHVIRIPLWLFRIGKRGITRG